MTEELPTWDMNRMGHILLTWPDGKELYFQLQSDVEAFFENEGIPQDDQDWGCGEFHDWSGYYDLAELP